MQCMFKGFNVDIPTGMSDLYEVDKMQNYKISNHDTPEFVPKPDNEMLLDSCKELLNSMLRLYPDCFPDSKNNFEPATDGVQLSSVTTSNEYYGSIDAELPPGCTFEEDFSTPREKELTKSLQTEKSRLRKLRFGKWSIGIALPFIGIGSVCFISWAAIRGMSFINWLMDSAWTYADKCASGSFLGISAVTLAILASIILALGSMIAVGIAFVAATGYYNKYAEWYENKSSACKKNIGELKKDLIDEIKMQDISNKNSQWAAKIEKIKTLEDLLGKELADEYKKIKEG